MQILCVCSFFFDRSQNLIETCKVTKASSNQRWDYKWYTRTRTCTHNLTHTHSNQKKKKIKIKIERTNDTAWSVHMKASTKWKKNSSSSKKTGVYPWCQIYLWIAHVPFYIMKLTKFTLNDNNGCDDGEHTHKNKMESEVNLCGYLLIMWKTREKVYNFITHFHLACFSSSCTLCVCVLLCRWKQIKFRVA